MSHSFSKLKKHKKITTFLSVYTHSCFCDFPSKGPPGRAGLPGADGLPGPPGTVLMLPVSKLELLKKRVKNSKVGNAVCCRVYPT